MFQEDVCVRKWLGGLAVDTARNRLPVLKSFFEFAGVGSSEAVEFQRDNPSSYRFVDLAYKWVESRNLAASSMRTRVGGIRGFFLANRAPLPSDKHRFHSDREKVVGELSVEDFRKILLSCNRTYRAAFLVQFQSGSGVGELCYINLNHAGFVWDEVRKGSRMIRLRMPGRKQNRNIKPYYTFIGSDAIDALKVLFHSRGWKQDTVLFRNEYGEPLSKNSLACYFRSHAVRAGVIKQHTLACLDCAGETVKQLIKKEGLKRTYYVCTVCQSIHLASDYPIGPCERGGVRYKAKPHELRDVFRTQCHYAQTYAGFDGSACEFFMGHSIDSLEYDKIMRDSSYAKSEYRKALPWLNILSEDPSKIDRTSVDLELESYKRDQAELRQKVEALTLLYENRLQKLEQKKP